MKKKDKKRVDFILNVIIIICAIVAIAWMFFFGVDADLNASRDEIFKFFTIDSNILLAIASLFVVLDRITNKRKYELCKFTYYFKYIAVVSTTLTFLTVIFVLLPLGFSPKAMFLGPNFVLHIINPVLGFVSLVWYESRKDRMNSAFVHGVVPAAFYSAVTLPLIVNHKITAPYPFMDIEKNGVVPSLVIVIVSLLVILALSYAIDKLNRNVNK